MKISLRPLVSIVVLLAFPAFASEPVQSILIQAGSDTVISLPAGKVLTVVSFTAGGFAADGGTPGKIVVQMPVGNGSFAAATVLNAYDPTNINDAPHSVTIAGQGSSSKNGGPEVQINFEAAQKTNTFVTYTISSN